MKSKTVDSIRRFFERDHDQMDALLALVDFSSPEDALRRFEEFARRLERHIMLEERFVLPALCTYDPFFEHGPSHVLKLEHRRILACKDAVLAALRANDGLEGERLARELRGALTPHHLKEEMILYPSCDELLSDRVAARVLSRVQAEAWV